MSKLQVNDIVDKDDVSAPGFSKGAVITGVCTATTFVGALTGNADTATTATSTSGNAGGLTGSPDIAVGQVTAGVTTFTDSGTSLATFNSTAANGPLINIKRSGTNIGFLGSGKNLHDSTGSADALGLRSQAEFTVATGGDSEKLRIDTSGRVLIGYTANVGGCKLQANTTGSAAFEGVSWYNGADHCGFSLRKSRGGLGDYTIVQDGDGLGLINFAGSDGNGWANGARIQATVDGTPGDGDMPTRLEFMTSPDGSSSVTERLRINNRGGFSFSNAELVERVSVTAGKLSDNTNVDLADGMVHLFTTAESTTSTPNIRVNSSTTLNDVMGVGDAITVTLITTANASAYSEHITIDGSAVTENWVGGSAPSGGGSSGVDIHAFTIIKTAANTYTVIGNHSKTS